jgi:hypothetical protein
MLNNGIEEVGFNYIIDFLLSNKSIHVIYAYGKEFQI